VEDCLHFRYSSEKEYKKSIKKGDVHKNRYMQCNAMETKKKTVNER
jgi:hypothetical protein